MPSKQIIECVPNFSEGRTPDIIRQITQVVETVAGVHLLDVDPGKATNRTVVTFVGEPGPVVEAAFLVIRKAAELIDMSRHSGEHPRMGATDVCPLIPISGISMEETAEWARRLGERVGRELGIPVYLYENAATSEERRNLANIRAGEYEGLKDKIRLPEWKPDFGPATFLPRSGATVIGARELLVAYNANLNTTSVRRANSVAFDIREAGRVVNEERIPGTCRGVKAIGWYIEEYGIAQVSMNLTNLQLTSVHEAFEACCRSADSRGMRVTGSELVGMAPLSVFIEAGKYFLKKQNRSVGVSEEELVKIAVRSLGLDELSPFDPKKKIIEYALEEAGAHPLVDLNLRGFANLTASESVAPGGGSVSAYVGALAASLGAMVANLSSHKRGWDDQWAFFSEWAERGQALKDALLHLVDEDTRSYNAIIEAFRLPKNTDAEKAARKEAVQAATRYAIEAPFTVMEKAFQCFDLLRAMVERGNPNSVTDAAVGVLCARAALRGAFLNVQVNVRDLEDQVFVEEILKKGGDLARRAEELENQILQIADQKLQS